MVSYNIIGDKIIMVFMNELHDSKKACSARYIPRSRNFESFTNLNIFVNVL